jgi:sodium-dependent dicarboxylate transporter 2/3/5
MPDPASQPVPSDSGRDAEEAPPSFLGKRWLRALLAAPLLLSIAGIGPTHWVEHLTHFSKPASVALLLIGIAAALWITEAIPLFATSFVLLFLELVWLTPVMKEAGLAAGTDAFLAPFFSNVVLLFLGGFVLSKALHKYGLDGWIAERVLERTAGKPAAVIGAMLFVSGFLSMWMSNTATAAMMLGLAQPMLVRVAPEDPFRRALPLAIAFGANLGGLGTPVGTPPNAIAIEALVSHGHPLGFATWLAMSAPFLLLLLGASWWILLRMYPPSGAALALGSGADRRITRNGKVVVGIALATALLWLTGGLHSWSTGTVALLPVVALFGLGLLGREDFLGLPWDVLILAGGGLSLGIAVERSGLGHELVAAIPVDALGQFGVALALVAVAALMTTFMSNTATANLLVPVVVGLQGVSTPPLLLAIAYACSCTMILPVSTPPNAIVFGLGVLRTRDMVRPAAVITGMALLLTLAVAPFWWGWLGLR